MKLVTVIVSLMLVLFSAGQVCADGHRDAARELMNVSGTQQIMSQMQLQIESMFLNISSDSQYNEKQRAIVDSYRKQVGELLKQEMIWSRIENDIIDIYMKSFSEQELQEMIAFYKTPLGQKMIDKMPEVMLRSAEISRHQMRTVIPKVKESGQAMSEELRAAQP